jgi:hypothetical protein
MDTSKDALSGAGGAVERRVRLRVENLMRGSGELAAFVSCCRATRLQDPEHEYTSRSYLANVKKRDFDADPLEVTCRMDCRLTFVEQEGRAVLVEGQGGGKKDADGMDEVALAIVKASMDQTAMAILAEFKEAKIKRAVGWMPHPDFPPMRLRGYECDCGPTQA